MTDQLDDVRRRWYLAKTLYADTEQKEAGPTASFLGATPNEAEETISEDNKTLLLEGVNIPTPRTIKLGDPWDKERRKKTRKSHI